MSKIVKNKVSGKLGLVLVGFEDGTTDLVTEDGNYDRCPTDNLVLVAEIDDIVLPAPPPTTTTQQEIVASALAALDKWETGALKLLAALPEGKEEEILMGDLEGLKKYLDGTPLEVLTRPGCEKYLSGVAGMALHLIEKKEEK